MSVDNKKVAYQILKFLESVNADASSPELDTAIASISKAFGVDSSSIDDFSSLSYFASSLPSLMQAGVDSISAQTYLEIKDEVEANPNWEKYLATVKKTVYFDGVEEGTVAYTERYAKVLQKFKLKSQSASTPGVKKSDPAVEKAAEEKKTEGNNAVAQQDYNAAVRLYTEALELSPSGPSSHIFLCNRAAAHQYLTSYDLAVEDSKACIAMNPKYAKGYTRLGQALSAMKNYDAAIEAYKKCVELEPKVKSHKDSLSQAKQKALEYRGSNVGSSSGDAGEMDMSALAGAMGGGGAGMPAGFAGMMQNPAIKKAAQDMMGNKKGIESMMKNPQMMNMAQKLMQNPQMMQQAMSMLGGGGDGGGGMPDLSALAGMMGEGGMPDLSALGGMGGAGGAAGGGFFEEDEPAPTSSSTSKGGKKGGSSSSGR